MAGGFPLKRLSARGMSGNPLLGLTRHCHKGLKVTETERRPIAHSLD
jgi:hypothetical protein